jgi:hypothetical protein
MHRYLKAFFLSLFLVIAGCSSRMIEVRGNVITPEAIPLEGVNVSIRKAKWSFGMLLMTPPEMVVVSETTSEADGSFSLTVPAGSFQLRAISPACNFEGYAKFIDGCPTKICKEKIVLSADNC